MLKKISRRILAALLCMAMVCSLVPTAFAGNFVPGSDAQQVSIDAAGEGAVLLENDGILPLDPKTADLAIFGRTQIDYIRGGGGSGDVNTSISYNFIDGLKEAGFTYDENLYDIYAEWCEEHPLDGGNLGMGFGPSNEEMPLTDAVARDAADNADVALVFIGRNSTEGGDHSDVAGDWQLSAGEKNMLSAVNKAFDNVVVVLNIGAFIDMTWVNNYNSISAVLNAWQPGSYGTLAIGRILSGDITPSGKLTSTWAYEYSDYPTGTANKFDATFGVNVQDPFYAEDIYVGYRYFETFAPDRVLYEFGYGMSYTTFEHKVVDFKADKDNVTVSVKVTNTGETYSGKDVVQIYYSAPQGKLGKPAYELAAYGKTDLLAPGKSQILTIKYKTNDMSSYDEGGVTGKKSAYVLEEGAYSIYAGSSVKNFTLAGTYSVASLTVTEQLSEALAPQTNLTVLTTGSYNAKSGVYATAKRTTPKRTVSVESKYDTNLPWVELTGTDANIKLADVARGTKTFDQFMAQFTLKELAQLFGGSSSSASMPVKAAGSAGVYGQDQAFIDKGVAPSAVADGPAGVRITMGEGDTGNTAFPVGFMLACTWNEEILKAYGEKIGEEAAYNDVDGWLAPALNIHRDPLCGRNFEYYSEDPVVAGVTAAAVTKGVQSKGVTVTLKHYAVNNQETSRGGGNSILSERAAREIYLKGFEICVKTANPGWIMSSYNQINGSQAASNYELITQIPRDEWGYKGYFMTDWGGAKDNGNASMLRAGHELAMPALTGFSMTRVPEGFHEVGSNMMSSTIQCKHCGKEVGSYLMFLIGYLSIKPWEACVDPPDGTCNRPLAADPGAPTDRPWATGYNVVDGKIYLGTGANAKYICDEADFVNDRTGIITGLIYGDVTMGEIERSATNIFTGLSKALYFRTQNGLGKTDYPHGDSLFVVTRSDLFNSHSTYINGYPDGTFAADGSIKRDEVAQILFNLGGFDTSGKEKTFPDVQEGKWYYEPVMALAKAGIIEGYKDGNFGPEDTITRAEFATMIVRYMGLSEGTGATGFSDVKSDHWAVGYIKAAVDAKYVKGYTDGTFMPEKALSRAEAVTVINRVLDRVGRVENIPENISIFPDVKRDHYAWADIVEAAVAHDYTIVSGNEVWNK